MEGARLWGVVRFLLRFICTFTFLPLYIWLNTDSFLGVAFCIPRPYARACSLVRMTTFVSVLPERVSIIRPSFHGPLEGGYGWSDQYRNTDAEQALTPFGPPLCMHVLCVSVASVNKRRDLCRVRSA